MIDITVVATSADDARVRGNVMRLAAAQAALQEAQTGPDLHSGTC